jgi:hypothetical protein
LPRIAACCRVAIVASHGQHIRNGFHKQNVNTYTSRLKSWMAPFKGVASRHLGSYLGGGE